MEERTTEGGKEDDDSHEQQEQMSLRKTRCHRYPARYGCEYVNHSKYPIEKLGPEKEIRQPAIETTFL